MTAAPCVLCGHPAQAIRQPGLPGVTSDCKPWPRCAPLWTCPACGLVQKAVGKAWNEAVEAIYAAYEMYALSDGREQLVFDTAVPAARSRVLIEALERTGLLPATGSMLDFGCGNGALFGQFREAFPGWRTAGLERDARRIEGAAAMNRPDVLFVGGPEAATGPFSLVTMLHVLEHLPDPLAVLAALRQRLAPDGLLVVLSPDCARNPFDLAIVDHRFHLTRETARKLLARAGFATVAVLAGPAKELALAARPVSGDAAILDVAEKTAPERALDDGLDWLARLAGQAQSQADTGALGIFGTAIGGVWLAGVLGERVTFFVDEDPDRRGKGLMGRPVLAPTDMPEGTRACLALPPAQARPLAERLARTCPGRTFIVPPGGGVREA